MCQWSEADVIDRTGVNYLHSFEQSSYIIEGKRTDRLYSIQTGIMQECWSLSRLCLCMCVGTSPWARWIDDTTLLLYDMYTYMDIGPVEDFRWHEVRMRVEPIMDGPCMNKPSKLMQQARRLFHQPVLNPVLQNKSSTRYLVCSVLYRSWLSTFWVVWHVRHQLQFFCFFVRCTVNICWLYSLLLSKNSLLESENIENIVHLHRLQSRWPTPVPLQQIRKGNTNANSIRITKMHRADIWK